MYHYESSIIFHDVYNSYNIYSIGKVDLLSFFTNLHYGFNDINKIKNLEKIYYRNPEKKIIPLINGECDFINIPEKNSYERIKNLNTYFENNKNKIFFINNNENWYIHGYIKNFNLMLEKVTYDTFLKKMLIKMYNNKETQSYFNTRFWILLHPKMIDIKKIKEKIIYLLDEYNVKNNFTFELKKYYTELLGG